MERLDERRQGAVQKPCGRRQGTVCLASGRGSICADGCVAVDSAFPRYPSSSQATLLGVPLRLPQHGRATDSDASCLSNKPIHDDRHVGSRDNGGKRDGARSRQQALRPPTCCRVTFYTRLVDHLRDGHILVSSTYIIHFSLVLDSLSTLVDKMTKHTRSKTTRTKQNRWQGGVGGVRVKSIVSTAKALSHETENMFEASYKVCTAGNLRRRRQRTVRSCRSIGGGPGPDNPIVRKILDYLGDRFTTFDRMNDQRWMQQTSDNIRITSSKYCYDFSSTEEKWCASYNFPNTSPWARNYGCEQCKYGKKRVTDDETDYYQECGQAQTSTTLHYILYIIIDRKMRHLNKFYVTY